MPADATEHQNSLPVLISEVQLRRRVAELAGEIAADHPQGEALILLGVLKGCIVFLADIFRLLPMPVEVELIQAASYDGDRPGPRLTIRHAPPTGTLTGRQVVLLDTMLDTGRTIGTLRDLVLAQRPRSLRTCVLLVKDSPRNVDVSLDYRGFVIDDVFVVGYGLDYQNRWRHLPYVAVLPPYLLEHGKEHA